MALKLPANKKILAKFGLVIAATLVLGGIGLAARQSLSSKNNSSLEHQAVTLPEVKSEVNVSEQTNPPKVEVKQETSHEASSGASVNTSTNSSVEHHDGTNNVSVTNQSSQSASSGNGSSASTNNSTSTNINIQNH